MPRGRTSPNADETGPPAAEAPRDKGRTLTGAAVLSIVLGDLSEAGQLISKASSAVEVEVPSVARESPVADVGNLPVGHRFDFHYEIHAIIIRAVDVTPAEGHLTTLPNNTDLPRRESERDQDRIEDLRNQVRTMMSRRIET